MSRIRCSGAEGASAVFGPQKGADPACVAELDRALANFAAIVERDLDARVAEIPARARLEDSAPG